jgi:glucosamine-6-phosphate deaminase
MRIVICPDESDLSRQAAFLVAAAIGRSPRMVLGLAAGATPIGLYHALGRHHADGLDFSGVAVFGLDEYFGLAADHPACFRGNIQRHFLNGVNIPPSRVSWPYCRPDEDIAARCAAYERAIADAGGIDVQVLGIGVNGHLGFNEPGSSLGGRTRLVRLSATTRHANERNFPVAGDMPESAVTQGIGTILEARRLLLMASGESKAAAVEQALEGPVTSMLPASAVQLHPNVTVFLDRAAASRLRRREEYEAETDMARRLGLLNL